MNLKGVMNRLINVAPHEWPRISIAWLTRFFLRTGFIMAWTILIAVFVSKRGIENLPYFFIAYGIFTMLGAIASIGLVRRIRHDILIMGGTLVGCVMLIIATFFMYRSQNIFISLSVFALGAVFTQLSIILSLFTEELFTPLESHRTFPIIESAEVIGGIVAGFLLTNGVNFLSPFKLLHIVVLILFCIVPATLFYLRNIRHTPALFFRKKNYSDPLTRLQEGWKTMKKTPFLRGLLVLVLMQWIFFTLLDFQYMRALEYTVQGASAGTQVAPQAVATDHATQLTQMLGTFHMVLFGGALIMQLLFASRILRSLGTITSIILHPIVAIASVFGVSIHFSLQTTLIAKATTEMTGVVYKNAYESSYYALPHAIRGSIKEMLEGIAKPIGSIIAMAGILVFTYVLSANGNIRMTNFTMMIALLVMGLALCRLRDRFTHLSTEHLNHSGVEPTKLQAIEILGQKGHTARGQTRLLQVLRNEEEPVEVKIKILDVLAQLQEPSTIPDILHALQTENTEQKLAALDALSSFQNLGEHFFTQTFSRHRTIQELEILLRTTADPQVKSSVMRVFANLRVEHVAKLLLEVLEESSPALKADAIRVMGLFRDPAIAKYILPYIRSEHPRVRAEALIALWQFQSYRPHIVHEVTNLLEHENDQYRKAGIYVLGEIHATWEQNMLWRLFRESNEHLRFEAAIALAKLEDMRVIAFLAKHIGETCATYRVAERTILADLPDEMQKHILQHIRKDMSHRIYSLVAPYTEKGISQSLPNNIVEKVKEIYTFLGEHAEAHNIETAAETSQ